MKNRGKEGFRMFPKPEEPHIAASRYMGRLFKKNVDSHVRYMDRSGVSIMHLCLQVWRKYAPVNLMLGQRLASFRDRKV